MVYDHQSKSSSWTPTPRKSSFFPPSHIQTKTEAKKGSELVGKLPSKAQRDKIRRSLFGDIPEMTGAKAENAPTEAKAVENPTQVSEEAASGEIQAKAETGLSQLNIWCEMPIKFMLNSESFTRSWIRSRERKVLVERVNLKFSSAAS